MVHLSGNGYNAAVRSQASPMLHAGKKTVHFGANHAENNTTKKEEKKELPFPTEPSFFKRAFNRVTQFFKDIFNAFAHLFSWKSAKEEAASSGAAFLGRPEILPVVAWLVEKDGLKAGAPHDPRTSEGRQKFAREMVDECTKDYGNWLECQEAAKKENAASKSSSLFFGRSEEY